MKFKIIRSKFIEGLKSVQNIVANKGSLPILQNVRIEAKNKILKMTTTDLDISIASVTDCEVIEEGSTTLPVKILFTAMTKVAECEVEVEVDDQDRATIKAGFAKFKLAGMSDVGFPKLPSDEDAYSYVIPQATLKEMLRKVAYSASQEDTRRSLKGVLMKFNDAKLTMVATDGRRLSLVETEMEFPISEEREIILTSKSVSELQRSLIGEGDIAIKVLKTQISFTLGNIVIYSKMIDEVYPNYQQVIPSNTIEHINVDRQLLLSALDRASVMTMDEAHSTKLIFESGRLIVTSAATDIGEAMDEVPIKYAGETIEILFNPSYVMEALKAIDDDEIIINLNNGHSPAVIKCSVPFIYVLMPLRIS